MVSLRRFRLGMWLPMGENVSCISDDSYCHVRVYKFLIANVGFWLLIGLAAIQS
jgi:hypothetical protein